MTITTRRIHRTSPFLLTALGLIAVTLLTGCRSELYDMEYGEPLEKSNFYADKRMSRPLVEGTVARNDLRDDDLFYTGNDESGSFSDVFPMEITETDLRRGQERFNIFCSPCHGKTGQGDGLIVQRGMKQPPSFHDQRLVESPAGYFFNVITNGFGVMYSYASRISPEDRWKIVAYVRALQKTGTPAPVAEGTAATEQPVPAAVEAGNDGAAADQTDAAASDTGSQE